MSSDWDKYVADTRSICKYGAKCYQKNPQHHETYKHPPQRKQNKRFSPYNRREKARASPKPDDKTETESVIGPKESQLQLPADDNPTSSSSVEQNQDEEPSIDIPDEVTFYVPDAKDKIEELFLTTMPTDFYKFFELLNADKDIVKTLERTNLQLIGPYDLLLGKLPILDNKELYLIHWRYFYDPPEFQSVLKRKGNSEYHIGYFRDAPDEMPVFLAENDSSKDCLIKPIADNIFGAVYSFLQKEKKTSPFIAMACQLLMQKIKGFAEENKFSLEEFNMQKRKSKTVARTFHGAGIVVPYNKKTQLGYRPLVENDATIKKFFTQLKAAENQKEKDDILSQLQPVITYAMIAVDECDFGTGLEAGINLFCSGLKELEPSALSSLSAAYSLLNREAFGKIIQTHLKYRRKGSNLSMLSLKKSCD